MPVACATGILMRFCGTRVMLDVYRLIIYIIGLLFIFNTSLVKAQNQGKLLFNFENDVSRLKNQLADDHRLTLDERLNLKIKLADLYLDGAYYEQAYDVYSQIASTIRQKIKKLSSHAYLSLLPVIYIKQAISAFYQGQVLTAYRLFNTAISFTSNIKEGDKIRASILVDLCTLNLDIGALDEAKDYCERAEHLTLRLYGQFHPLYISSLESLGSVYGEMGDYSKALAFFRKAYEIAAEMKTNHSEELLMRSARNLGFTYLMLRNLDDAYKIFKNFGIKDGLARYYLEKGLWKRGITLLNALASANSTGTFEADRKEIAIKIGLGLAYERKGDWQKALQYYTQAIRIVEKSWCAIPLMHRRNFLSAKIGMGFRRSDAFEGALRCLYHYATPNTFRQAFQYIEDVKSARFLEMIAGSDIKFKSLHDNKIWARDKQFQRRISRIERLERKSLRVTSLGQVKNFLELQQLKNNILHEYENFLKQVRMQSPLLGSMLSITAPEIEEIQSLIPPNSVLLNFLIGYQSSFLLIISQNESHLIMLPIDRGSLQKKIQPCFSDYFSKECTAVVDTLSSILISPAEKFIRKMKNIIVVPDLELFQLAWPAVKISGNFLVDRFTISTLPSASAFISLKDKKKDKPRMLLGFGNPRTMFTPLPHAEQEVLTIKKYFPKSKVFIRGKASEENFYQYSPEANVIHIAAHGDFNKDYPLLSAVVLSNTSLYDGYLRIAELFRVNLSKSNLVVLSTCFSGASYVTSGGEVIGLSRAIFYAGASSLIVANWTIGDYPTQELIVNFYKYWLKLNMSKAEALRRAQLDLKNGSCYKEPRYWAVFQLIGF